MARKDNEKESCNFHESHHQTETQQCPTYFNLESFFEINPKLLVTWKRSNLEFQICSYLFPSHSISFLGNCWTSRLTPEALKVDWPSPLGNQREPHLSKQAGDGDKQWFNDRSTVTSLTGIKFHLAWRHTRPRVRHANRLILSDSFLKELGGV